MALIFISYSSKDREIAMQIFATLKENGFDYIFLDHDQKRGIKSGEDWEKKLYQEIKRSHAMVLLISPHWIESKWCFAEYTQARSLGKEIIPLIISHGADNEVDQWIKNSIQKTDYTQDKDALQRVVTRIKEISYETQQGFEWDKTHSPYPGLKTFEISEAAVYFGREKEIAQIKEHLNVMSYRQNPRLLTIVAASGMGKSSLLKAGILARLEKFDKTNWNIIATMRPKRRPLLEFAKSISLSLGTKEYKKIYQQLQDDDFKDSLDEIVADLSFKQPYASILLPIDQAEEFFSIANPTEKDRMFHILHYLLEQDSFFTLWTLRSEFLKYFQTDNTAKALHPYVEDYLLSPLAPEKLTQVISKPAEVVGVTLEAELIEKLRNDVKDSESLPLLAHTLYKLYEKYHQKGTITLEDYLSFSNGDKDTEPMETILDESAEESIKKFKDDLQTIEALKQAFIPHMVRIDEASGEYLKRVAEWNELPERSYEAIDALVNNRLLIKKYDDKSDTLTVEIAHEALLRGWKRLKKWINDEKEFLSIKARVEIAMHDWEKSDKSDDALLKGIALTNASQYLDRFEGDELAFISASLQNEEQIKQEQERLRKSKERLQRRLFLGSLGFGGVSMALGGFAFFKQQEAQKQKAIAERQKRIALNNEEKAKEELRRAKHNIGLALAEKAKNYYENGRYLLRANLYAYSALKYINPKMDDTNSIRKTKELFYELDRYFINQKTLTGDKISVESVVFSPDGKTLASASWDKTIKLWDAKSGNLIQTPRGHEDFVSSVAFSPDGKILASGSGDKTIKLWDAKSGNLIQTLTGHKTVVRSVAFSPDGKILASGSSDDTIKLWDAKSGNLIQTLRGHKEDVESVAFSPDGKTLASGSWDKTIKLWDAKSGKLIQTLRGHKEDVESVAFSPKGKTLASSSEDHTVKLWNIAKLNDPTFIATQIKKFEHYLGMRIEGTKLVDL